MTEAQSPILVTGGAGYIGSQIVKVLSEHGLPVVVVDDLSSGFAEAVPADAIFYKNNIGNAAKITSILKSHKIQSVIHMAASIAVDESVANPLKYYQNNVGNTVTLLQSCVSAGVTHFVFSSTAAVYGTPEHLPVTEADPLNPESPYGASKAMAERAIIDTAAASGLRYVILRYFNVAGASLDGKVGQRQTNVKHLIGAACDTACGKRSQLNIYGMDYPTRDGTAERDFIHVADLANIHMAALRYLENGNSSQVLNCGYGRGYTVQEIVNTVRKVSGVHFAALPAPRRPGDIARIFSDNSKLKTTLDWSPQCDDIEQICKSAFDWVKRQS